jgi:hypothetical protein
VDSLVDIIPALKRVLDNLEKIQDEKGVPKNKEIVNKNITNSSLNKENTAELSGREVKKLRSVFTIFSEVFFEYQKKFAVDTKPKTLISTVAKPIEKQKEITSSKKTNDGILGFLMSLLVPLGGLIASAIALISGFFTTGLMGDVQKVLGKIGIGSFLKIIGKSVAKISLKLLKRLPYIGGIISLFYAYKAFQEGKLAKGFLELISGLINFIPGVGFILSIGVDILIGFLEAKGAFNEGGSLSNTNAMSTIQGWMGAAGKFIKDNALNIPIIATFTRFGMAWDAFSAGNWGEGFKQIFYGIISIAGGGEYIVNGVEWLVSVFQGARETPAQQLTGNVIETIKGWVASAGKFISDNALYLPIIGGIQRFGMAWDSFSNGDLGEGFKQLALGIITFVGGGPIVAGFEFLHGWLFGEKEEDKTTFNSKTGVMSRLKNWIKSKLENLPMFLRKPLEWLGILEETDDNKVSNEISNAGKGGENSIEEKSGGFFSSIADSIGNTLNSVGDMASDIWGGLTNIAKNAFDKISTTFNNLYDGLVSFLSTAFDVATSFAAGLLVKIKNASTSNTLKTAAQALRGVYEQVLGEEPVNNASNSKNGGSETLEIIKQVSLTQAKLLTILVNNSTASLAELKRMNGSKSTSSSPIVIPMPQSGGTSQNESMQFGNNRAGYANSVYTL